MRNKLSTAMLRVLQLGNRRRARGFHNFETTMDGYKLAQQTLDTLAYRQLLDVTEDSPTTTGRRFKRYRINVKGLMALHRRNVDVARAQERFQK